MNSPSRRRALAVASLRCRRPRVEGVVVVGAGGHAKVIVDILRSMRCYAVVGCTDRDPDRQEVLGVPVLGDDAVLELVRLNGTRRAIVALGDNRARQRASLWLEQLEYELVNAVSPCATVSTTVRLGSGVAVMPGVVVNADSVIGDGVILNTGATVDHDCEVGDFAHVAPGCNLAGTVRIGKGAFLGIGSRVVPGVTVGEWTVVGAGAVVIEDLPPGVTALGVPARIVRTAEGRVRSGRGT